MDVVTVRVEQGIADVSPWPFGARPRAEELDVVAAVNTISTCLAQFRRVPTLIIGL